MTFRTTAVITYDQRDDNYHVYDQMMDFVKKNYAGKWSSAGELEKHLLAYVEFRGVSNYFYAQHFGEIVREAVPGIERIDIYDWAGKPYRESPARNDLILAQPGIKKMKKKTCLEKLCFWKNS